MLILMTSPDSVLRGAQPDPALVQALTAIRGAGNPVGLVSNQVEPDWFGATFGGTGVQFLKVLGRQSGDIVRENAERLKVSPHDSLVLATKSEDVQMGKNGQAVLLGADWSTDPQVSPLGIRVRDAAELQQIVQLASAWAGRWWYSGTAQNYSVMALADLSGYGQSFDQQVLASKLTTTVKSGGANLNALLAITARSALVDGIGSLADLVWGVYPSSSSANNDSDLLVDFTHRLRTTVSRVRFAKRGEPLFIRHSPSPKRSAGGGGDRTDPTNQIETLHLNPFYREKDRLVGKNVVIVDDCTTYGVSFGVAAAFLRKAGAASVRGIALGKFGNQLREYHIVINSNPFQPVRRGGYTAAAPTMFPGATNSSAKQTLKAVIP